MKKNMKLYILCLVTLSLTLCRSAVRAAGENSLTPKSVDIYKMQEINCYNDMISDIHADKQGNVVKNKLKDENTKLSSKKHEIQYVKETENGEIFYSYCYSYWKYRFFDSTDILYYADKNLKTKAKIKVCKAWKGKKSGTGSVLCDLKLKKSKVCMILSSGEKTYCYAEYDVNKKKFTKSNIINMGPNVSDVRFYGDKYVGIKKTGTFTYDEQANKVTDERKRSVVVCDNKGNRCETDFTKCLKNYSGVKNFQIYQNEIGTAKLTTGKPKGYSEPVFDYESMEDHADVIEVIYDIKGDYIYIAADTGIYKGTIGKDGWTKVMDISNCDFVKIGYRRCDFKCINDKKFAFILSENVEEMYVPVLIVVQ